MNKFNGLLPVAGIAASALSLAAVLTLLGLGRSSKPTKLQLLLAQTLGMSSGSYLLKNVKVPIAVMDQTTKDECSIADQTHLVDQEGLVACHILIQSGKIAQVTILNAKQVATCTPADTPSVKRNVPSWYDSYMYCPTVECHGSIIIPCFSDAHTHMVKTQTAPRNRNMSGTMTEALRQEILDTPRWRNLDDVFRLMDFAAKCALHHGTRAIRTHLDGCASEDSNVREAVYQAFDTVRDKYSPDLIVQGVANLFLPEWLTPMAEEHVERAATHANVVLGAYVGNTANIPQADTVKAMDALFGYAQKASMDVDLHIDESNDEHCCAALALIESLTKARKSGYKRHVVLGHCCTFSLQTKETLNFICTQLATLNTSVVSNPFTNLGLQDRKGSGPPWSKSIPQDEPRTPLWRGLTTLQELRAAGVNVASASDNVRDYWYPYGDYDMLTVWAQGQAMGHLDTAPSEGAWADICTVCPAKAMGVPMKLSKGEVADLVMFPSARRASELFARPQTDRLVVRRGKVQTSSLPDFSELDDLVAIKTRTVG
jgi:cytosine deaminase